MQNSHELFFLCPFSVQFNLPKVYYKLLKDTTAFFDTTANIVVRGVFGTSRPIKILLDNNAHKVSPRYLLKNKNKNKNQSKAHCYSL